METTTLPIESLIPDGENPNRGTERGREMVRHSLARLGAGRSILLDARGAVIAGNKTLEAARDAGHERVLVVETDGETLVAVKRRDLDLAEGGKARELSIADNATSFAGLEWDAEAIAAQLDGGMDLSAYFSGDELEALLADLREPGSGLLEDADPDAIPEEVEPKAKRGDLFILGRHRIMCGDSTNADDVARLMDGKRVDACITDPPYSVEYDRSQSERGGDARVHSAYHEGDPGALDVLVFMGHIPTDVLVMTYPIDRHFFALASALQACRMDLRKELIWVKDSFSFWPGAQYQQQHEPILICARKGAPVGSDVPANQSTVFEYPRPRAHDLHPTQRPVDLWAKLVEYHIRPGNAVYDPFCGSGTTVIAAHQTGRVCYAMEIAPQYVDTTIARYETATGETARRLS